MRAAPRIPVTDIVARVVLEPNGNHQIEVTVPSEIFGMAFQPAHLAQLEAVCARARAVIATADGGPDFYQRKVIPIEVKP